MADTDSSDVIENGLIRPVLIGVTPWAPRKDGHHNRSSDEKGSVQNTERWKVESVRQRAPFHLLRVELWKSNRSLVLWSLGSLVHLCLKMCVCQHRPWDVCRDSYESWCWEPGKPCIKEPSVQAPTVDPVVFYLWLCGDTKSLPDSWNRQTRAELIFRYDYSFTVLATERAASTCRARPPRKVMIASYSLQLVLVLTSPHHLWASFENEP